MKPNDGSSTKPLWAEEFSVHAADDAYVLRRQFTKFLVLTSVGMAAGNGWIWAKSLFDEPVTDWPRLTVARASELAPGTVKMFTYPTATDPCILVRRVDGEFAAFSQQCTHLSCAVIPQPEHSRLYCPCHEGAFDLRSGRPIAGPPNRPLTRVTLDVRGEDVYASGIELRTV